MPDRIARKVPARTPIYTHHDVQRQDALDLLDRVARFGGRATAHVLALQSFRLQLARVGDANSTVTGAGSAGVSTRRRRARPCVRWRLLTDRRRRTRRAGCSTSCSASGPKCACSWHERARRSCGRQHCARPPTSPISPSPSRAKSTRSKASTRSRSPTIGKRYRLTVQSGEPEIVFRHYLECVLESLERMGA